MARRRFGAMGGHFLAGMLRGGLRGGLAGGCVGGKGGCRGESEGGGRAGKQEGNAGTCRHDINSRERPGTLVPGPVADHLMLRASGGGEFRHAISAFCNAVFRRRPSGEARNQVRRGFPPNDPSGPDAGDYEAGGGLNAGASSRGLATNRR